MADLGPAPGARKTGRPTTYRREYPKIAAHLLVQGYSQAQVAGVLRVGRSTLTGWKRFHPEFA